MSTRGRRSDRLLVAAVIAGLVLALLKPWAAGDETRFGSARGSPPGGSLGVLPAAIASTGTTAAAPAVTGFPLASPPATLSAAGLPVALSALSPDQPADHCYEELGWLVCLLGAAPDARLIRSRFDPDRRNTVAGAPTTLALLIMGSGGAGLGFYAPLAGLKSMPGRIFATAWQIDDPINGTATMPLQLVGDNRLDGPAGPRVFLTSAPGFATASTWPVGGYVFLVASDAGLGRQEYFLLEVSSTTQAMTGR